MKRPRPVIAALALAVSLAGCGTLARNPVPPELTASATIPDMPEVRAWAGAFGAGFLNGWTATGRRPLFKVVTGVSTGALIAPFALAGSRYDRFLEEAHTGI
ncbi:MAG: hypothetical protein ACREVP_12735, partial [Burkholderiales bacterium]